LKKIFTCLLVFCLLGCEKQIPKSGGQVTVLPEIKNVDISSSYESVEHISFDSLVGKWILLDSEGNVDSNGDYIAIDKDGSQYKGFFIYQGKKVKITVKKESEAFFIISERGEKYTIGRTESTRGKAHNGIWLALGDIDLGNFQREDILKNMVE